LDIYLLNDQGEPERPWLAVIIDDYSRAIAGFGVSFRAPSILQTLLVLRQAIWRKASPHWHLCGIPDVFYTDHGSDFTSRHLEQVGADLHMALVFSQAGVPRGRGKIERWFRTLSQLFLCGLPGYAPEGSKPRAPKLPLSAFEAKLERFILDEYHQRPHGETGMPPQARWEAGGFLPRLQESLEQLDLLLLTGAMARRVRQDGIHCHGFRYLDPILAAYVGESVMIRHDPRDMAEGRVFYQERFLGRAVCPELAGETVPLREVIRARNQRRQELRHTLRERARMVDVLLEAHRGDQQSDELPARASAVSAGEKAHHQETSTLKRYRHD
jgi:putative transposase